MQASELRQAIAKSPLVLVRDQNVGSKQDLLELVSLKQDHSDLLHWDFGPVMELKVDSHCKNYLFSEERVPFHWDGAFFKTPSYLVFHCLEAPDPLGGGETLFTDTTAIYQDATPFERQLWGRISLRVRTEKKAHYGGEVTVKLVDQHPRSGVPILRFAEAVLTQLNPVSLEVIGVTAEEKDRFIEEMTKKVYSPRYCTTHRWKTGDLLIADNYTLIHGRNAITHGSPRHIRRVQIL